MYTSEQEYMTMYIESRVNYYFGLSFLEFIQSPIDRMLLMHKIGKKESENQNNTMRGLADQIGDMNNGL